MAKGDLVANYGKLRLRVHDTVKDGWFYRIDDPDTSPNHIQSKTVPDAETAKQQAEEKAREIRASSRFPVYRDEINWTEEGEII